MTAIRPMSCQVSSSAKYSTLNPIRFDILFGTTVAMIHGKQMMLAVSSSMIFLFKYSAAEGYLAIFLNILQIWLNLKREWARQQWNKSKKRNNPIKIACKQETLTVLDDKHQSRGSLYILWKEYTPSWPQGCLLKCVKNATGMSFEFCTTFAEDGLKGFTVLTLTLSARKYCSQQATKMRRARPKSRNMSRRWKW